jgi:hypothetical protein
LELTSNVRNAKNIATKLCDVALTTIAVDANICAISAISYIDISSLLISSASTLLPIIVQTCYDDNCVIQIIQDTQAHY